MPVYATIQNTIFDVRCSKCKKSSDPIYHTQNGRVYITCNECRAKAARRRTNRIRDNLSPEFLAHLALRPRLRNYDTGDDDAVNAVLALSSSAAAASTSSADYFVAEPDPEPEPESP